MGEYKKVLEIDPEHAYAHYDMGYIYRKNGEYKKALEAYKKVLEIDPEHPYAYYDMGLIYEELGMKNRADEEFGIYHKTTDSDFLIEDSN
ncbi:MAG: tetratricopeptide repeat protein [Candidatus Mariimomonas ferrooxydans]